MHHKIDIQDQPLAKGRAPHASPTLAELSKSSGKRLILGSLDIT